MFERVIVPLDATRHGESALPYVTMMAKQLQQTIVLLTVVPDPEELNPIASEYTEMIGELTESRMKRAKLYLDGVAHRLQDESISTIPEVSSGSAADAIISGAATHLAGLIAMATHGLFGSERWFVGSVADRVVRTTSVPVLLLRPSGNNAFAPNAVTKILVPLDGSVFAEAALRYGTFLAKEFNVPLVLLRAVPSNWNSSGATDALGTDKEERGLLRAIEDQARAYLAEVAQRIGVESIKVESEFADRVRPATAITDYAAQHPGTLVVMSTHGRSGLARTLLGSVADAVIRSSLAPVIVIPPED